MAFLKQASLKIENPEVTVNTWVGNRGNVRTAANKMVEYKKILADFHPDNYLLTHCTIVASVDVENSQEKMHFGSDKTKDTYSELVGRSDYYITPQTSKYMNANGDAWSRELLKKSYRTFIGAENYVEHVQDPALSKGKILDAVAREVDDGKSIFIDILVATNKKHSDLVRKIKTGDLQTLSMGAIVAFTICSHCGRVAADETELCQHVKFLKRNSFISENDGKKRITAELCGHFLYPESNKFIEGSWVETPAFKGAVMRNEVSVDNIEKLGFTDSIEPALLANLNIKNMNLAKTASKIVKAFQIVDQVRQSFTEDIEDEDSLEESKPEKPTIEDVKDLPVDDMEKEFEESNDDKESPSEEKPSDEGEDRKPEELPEEIQEMGEDPSESTDELDVPNVEDEANDAILDEKSKQPYDAIKEEIKIKLKDEIKKELLRDLGIDLDSPGSSLSPLDNANLNDTLVKSSYNRIKSACIIASEVGLRNIPEYGFNQKDILKIAELSGKYSINKEVFKVIHDLEKHRFPTFRRFAKEIEKKLGRDLDLSERESVDSLVCDLFI